MTPPTTQLPQFKGQPWVVFDTIASRSFLVGEDRPAFQAFNTAGPAISARGEMIFFATSRTKAQAPWYTNLDLQGQLAYGFEAWQVFVKLGMPVWPDTAELQPDGETGEFIPQADGNVSPPMVLAQLIVNFGVLELDLGQEEQLAFPVHRFGAGGGIFVHAANGNGVAQNAVPQDGNMLALPEPIEIARTQNISAIIRLAPEVLATIGFPVVDAEGVGNPLPFPTVECQGLETTTNVPPIPFSIQVGLVGKRIKKTQYGQLPNEK